MCSEWYSQSAEYASKLWHGDVEYSGSIECLRVGTQVADTTMRLTGLFIIYAHAYIWERHDLSLGVTSPSTVSNMPFRGLVTLKGHVNSRPSLTCDITQDCTCMYQGSTTGAGNTPDCRYVAQRYEPP